MTRQTVTPRKKRGPPATGKGTPITVRLQPPLLARLDEWAAAQEAESRPEAIRRLLEHGLSAPAKKR
jgi:metal-responsive CopG/Arc/MetJ family transcriptional regulator